MYIPDMLTRMNINESDNPEDHEKQYINLVNILASKPIDISLSCQHIIKSLSKEDIKKKAKSNNNKTRNSVDDFSIINDILYFTPIKNKHSLKKRVVIPRKLRSTILKLFHDDPLHGGHLAQEKTLSKIREEYYWKNNAKSTNMLVCLNQHRLNHLLLKHHGTH